MVLLLMHRDLWCCCAVAEEGVLVHVSMCADLFTVAACCTACH